MYPLVLITYGVVYFKSHHCDSSYGASSTYYLTDTEHFNMHHRSNACEQTRENVWCNINGVKDCKKTIVLSLVSFRQKILVNVLKQSWKFPKLKCFIKYCKVAKKNFLFGNIQHLICGKKVIILILRARRLLSPNPPTPKKWSNVPPKQFLIVFLENNAFLKIL